jgi:Ca-activated chloride channel homolog
MGVVIRVPELLADEVRHLVLGVRMTPRPVALDAPVAVAEVGCTFERIDAGRLVRETGSCKAMARFVAPADAQLAPDPELDREVAIAQLVRVQIEAEEAARQGRWTQAAGVTCLFQEALVVRGHNEVASAAEHLAGTVGDAASFERSKAYRSSLRKGSTRSVGSTYEAGAEADLRAMGRGQSTEAQKRMERSFGATGEGGGSGPARLDRKRSRRW